MRLRLTCNGAGDIRLQCLRDSKAPLRISPPKGGALVCSDGLQEMTTPAVAEPKVGFGKISNGTTFGRQARSFVREAGAAISSAPLRRCTFLTGTLPGSTSQALQALAAWSGWLVGAVEQSIRDFYPGTQLFGCWEYQRRGALHLHVCVLTPTAAQAVQLRQGWKARWIKLLTTVSRKAGVDLFEREDGSSWSDRKWVTRTDAQQVERSVSSYLAKYLSKGSAKNRKVAQYPPSRWWFCSQSLRDIVRSRRLKTVVEQLPLSLSLDWYERIAGFLVSQSAKTFAYNSPYDCSVRGVITLLSPIEASMFYDSIVSMLASVQRLCAESPTTYLARGGDIWQSGYGQPRAAPSAHA